MKSYRVQATVDAEGSLTARVRKTFLRAKPRCFSSSVSQNRFSWRPCIRFLSFPNRTKLAERREEDRARTGRMDLEDAPRLASLDSSAVIDLIDARSSRHTAFRAGVWEAKDEILCVSDLVRLEVSVGPFMRNVPSQMARLHSALRGLTRLQMPEEVNLNAPRLRADHGLKTPRRITRLNRSI